MKQFDSRSYPFLFFCNSTGDLFLPSEKEGEEKFETLQDISDLPYPLQGLYEKYWSEQYGWLTYLVKYGEQYGLMLEHEFSEDRQAPDYLAKMDDLYQEAMSKATAIEKALAVFCPPAEVLVGNSSGFEECHELCIFVPATASQHEMTDMLYILHLADMNHEIPVEQTLYTEEYWDFVAAQNFFSTLHGIAPAYENEPTVTLEFSAGEDCTISVRVVKSFLYEGKFDMKDAVKARLEKIIESIQDAARQVGATPSFEELFVRACNTVFPGGWELSRPLFTICIAPQK